MGISALMYAIHNFQTYIYTYIRLKILPYRAKKLQNSGASGAGRMFGRLYAQWVGKVPFQFIRDRYQHDICNGRRSS